VPGYTAFLMKLYELIKYTKRAVETGYLPRIDYHPPYLQLEYG